MRRLLLASTVLGWSFAAHAQTTGSGSAGGLNYVTLTSPDGCSATSPCQIVTYLHYLGGEGATPSDIQKYFNNSAFWSANPHTIVVAPMVNGSSDTNNWGGVQAGVSPNMQAAVAAVKQIEASVPTNPKTVVLTGGSMGGIGTEAGLVQYGPNGTTGQHVFASGLSYDGADYIDSQSTMKSALCGVPYTMVHGTADTTVPYSVDQTLAGTLSGCSGFSFVPVQNATHGTWNNPSWQGYGAGTLIDQALASTQGGIAATASVTPMATPIASTVEPSNQMVVTPTKAVTSPAASPGQITPDSGTLTDASGSEWTISASGSIMQGDTYVPGGGGTSALTMVDGVVYGLDAHGKGWFTLSGDGQYWTNSQPPPVASGAPTGTSPTATPSPLQIKQDFGPTSPCVDAATGVASTGFHVAGGQIIGPNGKPFIARGINLYEEETDQADAAQATFKGLNFIRINIHTYKDPSTYTAFVQKMTSQGIVVEFEDHPDAGGGQDPAFTGTKLAAELAWYASMAKAYASNPYVWYGTFNEPGTQGGSVSAWEKQTYDAIRGAGNNNPVLLEIVGWPGAWNNSMNASDFSSMTNVIWDTHFYGWVARYSDDQATVDKALADIIAQVQQMPSADGIMPAIIGEYGDSTDGKSLDPNGTQAITAVINAGTNGKAGSAAWHWNTGNPSNQDKLMNGSDPSSPFGQMVQLFINTDVVPPTACQANTKAIQTLSTIQDTLTQTDPGTSTPTLTEAEAQQQADALQAQLDALNAQLATMKEAP